MNHAIMALISMELDASLNGGVLRNVHETEPGTFYLTFYAGSEKTLYARLKGDAPAICLCPGRDENAMPPSSFCMLMRKRLKGKRVTGAAQLNSEKTTILSLEGKDGRYSLIFDFSRNEGNIIILSGSKIAGSYFALPGERRGEDGEYVFREPNERKIEIPAEEDLAPCIAEGKMSLTEKDGGEPFESVSDMVFKWARGGIGTSRFERKKRELLGLFGKELKKLEKRRAAISGDLKKLEENETLAEIGKTLLAYAWSIGEKEEVELESIDSPGKILRIKLDPSLSTTANAEKYFEKYKKSKRGLPILRERLAETEDKTGYIREASNAAEAAETIEELFEIESAVRSGTPVTKTSSIQFSEPRKYSFMGFTILSGKNAAQNDEVSTRLAARNDIWFHAGGMGGSHVIIKTKSGEKTPKEVMVRAAEIAAFHSKGRNSSKVPVSYTQAKNVTKKKGMPQGMVSVSKVSSIVVNPTGYDFSEWIKRNENNKKS